MESCEEYINEGWYISKDGYNLVTENGMVKTRKSILENILNTDIKDFGEPVLSNLLKKGKTEKIVLQIQKIRNISAPKSKEDSQVAPRMLKLILTDGHTNCQAIEISSVSSLCNKRTPPGSKLLINNAKIISNCILLSPNCCTLLGGKVPLLFEKWELAKNMSEHVRSSAGSDGPPPWVNFGEKIISLTANESFKSLASKVTKDTTNEFDVHRQDAIASAATGAVKKVFGGGTKTTQDNQLINLRKSNNSSRYNNNENYNNQEYSRGPKNKRENNREKMINEKSQKPSEKISLFDFVENKLSFNETDNKSKTRNFESLPMTIKPEMPRTNVQQKDFSRNQDYPGFYHQQNRSFNNFSKPMMAVNKNPGNNINVYQNNRDFNLTTNPIEKVTKSFEKASLNNSPFASRSLQQHLNLAKDLQMNAKPRFDNNQGWKIGDLCRAKYWEDGKFYEATITNLTDRTCVVQFNGYGNVEEVLKTDCLPANNTATKQNYNRGNSGYYNNRRTFSNNRSFNYKPT